MMLTRSAAFIGAAALLQLAVAQETCYHFGGVRSADVPCEASAGVSVCCTSADACLPDGLCRLDDEDAARDIFGVGYALGTCTDPSWASDVCFGYHLLVQDSRHGPRTASFVARRAFETTATAASTVSSTGSSGSGGGLSTGAKAGIGIGVALGIVALGAAGYFQRQARLKRRAPAPGGADNEKSGQHGCKVEEAAEQTAPVMCEGGTCSRLRMVGA